MEDVAKHVAGKAPTAGAHPQRKASMEHRAPVHADDAVIPLLGEDAAHAHQPDAATNDGLPPAAKRTPNQLLAPSNGIYPGKDGGQYVRLGNDYYRVRQDAHTKQWEIVDPNNPYAF